MRAWGPLVKRPKKPQRRYGPSLACNQRTPHLLGGFARWRRGREAEGGGLLNRYTLKGVSRVRIPPSPPFSMGYAASSQWNRGILRHLPQPRNHPHLPLQRDGLPLAGMLRTGGSLLLFAVGLKLKGKSDHVVVDGEDALIAALKAKAQYPEALITYVRRQNRRGDARHPAQTLAKDSLRR